MRVICSKAVLILSFLATSLYANAFQNSDSIEFNIILHDINADINNGQVEIRIYNDYSSYFNFIGSQTHKLEVKNNQSVRFKFPREEEPTWYFTIMYYPPNDRLPSLFYSPLKVFVVRKIEKLNCELFYDSLFFGGQGSASLNCQNEVLKHMYQTSEGEIILSKGKAYSQFFNVREHRLDSIYNLQNEILKQKRYLFDDTSYFLIKNGCLAYKNYNMLRELRFSFPERRFAAVHFFDSIFQIRETVKPLFAKTPFYTDYILLKEVLNSEFKIDSVQGDQQIKVFKKVYDSLKFYYSGIFRDKLMCTYFMFDYRLRRMLLNELNDSRTIVRSKPYQRIVDNLISSMTPGMVAFPFELPDTNGKLIKLSDFKNKIVIADFWFTGCFPCMVLSQKMQEIKARYRNNEKVVFININVNQKKEDWLSGISSGKYSSKDDINVYTNGQGYDHPLLRHYNFNSFPRQLLVDGNGKVIAVDPPRPITEGNITNFVKIIDSLLNSGIQIAHK